MFLKYSFKWVVQRDISLYIPCLFIFNLIAKIRDGKGYVESSLFNILLNYVLGKKILIKMWRKLLNQ